MPMFYDKDGKVLGVSSEEIVNFPYDSANLKYEGTRGSYFVRGIKYEDRL